MKKGMSSVFSVLLAMGLFVSISTVVAASDESAALLPGITTKDDRPNGCVDCHVNDLRLNTLLGTVKGHPDVSKIVKKIPDNCLLCHKGTGKAPALANLVHGIHFKDAATNDFITKYKGQCLSCHQLVQTSGEVKVKTGTANW